MIAIGSDHAGVKQRQQLIEYLQEKGEQVCDLGCYSEDSVDYPMFAEAVCEKVQNGQADWGILVCGTGIGMSLAANKCHGIRAALVSDAFSAQMAKEHNNAIVVCMGARVLSVEQMEQNLDAFMGAQFQGGKHERRIEEIMALESQEDTQNCRMGRVIEMKHPLIQHKVSVLRDKKTSLKEFRELTEEISMLMGYEVTRDLQLTEVEIETPICMAKTKVIAGKKLGIVPILRAGLGMVEGMLRLVPAARVGHIGVYRDPETLKPVEYYCKLPSDVAERDLLVLDPMLATGGSAIAAIEFIKKRGGKNIRLVNMIAAPEGIKAVREAHPDVDIYVAAIDQGLNEHGYIVPGLGDAGDRLFGTK